MPSAKKTPYFEVRRSKIHGLGAFALRKIRKGARIVEYVGELIDDEEASRRYDDRKMKRHHTFLFGVGEEGMAIDAGVNGNDARFINHSCEPNCEAIEYDDLRVFIYALRTIQPGEELSYDYAFSIDRKPTKADLAFYVCRCGAPGCRGTTLAIKKKK
jgi:SET domain-containing protein